jgi:2-C-methyl-D-erythritol 4-phosphate cytidylyltransferase
MESDLPKQYLPLAGATVLEHTLGALLACDFIETVVVVLHGEDEHFSSLALAADPRLMSTTGGAERCDSVLAGLDVLAGMAADDDWVLVHDAARPCISREDLQRLREALADDPVGGLLAVPIAETVKQVDAGGRVEQTLDRNRLWLAQTPQMFRVGMLRTALRQAAARDVVVTDEAAAMELTGERPRVVRGDSSNIKLTRPADLAVAASWLAQGKN